jgi:TolA-binding protein
MKKIISSFLLLSMMLLTQFSFAENKTDSNLSFWEKLRAKIEQMTPQKKVAATTAVGGVRGAKVASDDVYWKGEKVAQTVDSDEFEAFNKAMALVTAGELEKAQAAFAEFVSKNPESPLRKDADQALAQLQAVK